MSTGQAHELAMALGRNGWSNAEIKLACKGDTFAQFRQVILGHAEIRVAEHVIDCDADPMIPDGWKLEEHQKSGQLKWDPTKVHLFLSGPQQKSEMIGGYKLREELKGKPVLNACVLDYLLKNQHLIPEDWKQDDKGRTRYIFFWGTIFRDSGGDLGVKYLCWSGGQWSWSFCWLVFAWVDQRHAAMRAS